MVFMTVRMKAIRYSVYEASKDIISQDKCKILLKCKLKVAAT